MKQFLITVAGVFAGLLLFVVVLPVLLIMSVSANASKSKAPKGPIVLTLDLRAAIPDQRSSSGLAALSGGASTVDIVRKLQQAATDAKVKGVFIRAAEGGLSPAQAEEVRAAIKRFRSSGKFVYAHAQGFGGVSLSAYPAVSAVDQLWLQPSGDFAIAGLVSDTLFLKGFFEKIKVEPDFEQFYEYKNAVNQYTQKDFTPAHREAVLSLLNGEYDALTRMAGEDRGVGQDGFKALLQKAPYAAPAAVEAKLVDKLGQPEEAAQAALDKAGAGARMLDLAQYDYTPAHGPVIALVGGAGAITDGAADPGLFSNDDGIKSDDLAKAIDDAGKAKDVRAIVLRVDSPGGSVTASDQIYAAVQRAQKAGKPVVVSMAGLAASGGYWISMGADKIVSNETTITGSIGIFGGKLVTEGALNAIGLNESEISVGGPFAAALSSEAKFTPEQRAAFIASLQRGYDRFIANVAAGRKLPEAKVREIAKGRVWTGGQAKGIGLVDRIGGLSEAIDEAKTLAKIDAKTTIALRVFPKQRAFSEVLRQWFGGASDEAEGARVLATLGGDQALLRLAQRYRQIHEARGAQAYEPTSVH